LEYPIRPKGLREINQRRFKMNISEAFEYAMKDVNNLAKVIQEDFASKGSVMAPETAKEMAEKQYVLGNIWLNKASKTASKKVTSKKVTSKKVTKKKGATNGNTSTSNAAI